ncbi:MAG: hypothetical protein LBC73_10455 [Oscillospiraceae bacterium]|jgi:hypothetical protein|nr:hypothetical protein [Oscillospiraceae bacterium]
MKKLKVFCVVLAFVLLLATVLACATNDTPPNNDNPDAGIVTPTGNQPGDDNNTNPNPGDDNSGDVDLLPDDDGAVGHPPIRAVEPEPLEMTKDMGIVVNGEWFPIWQDASALLNALGDDYELSTAPSCVFEGDDKEFAYDRVFVFTNPDGSRDLWFSIFIIDNSLSTARGITVGSTLDEVIAAYGSNHYWEGSNILTYSLSGIEGDIDSPCIQFTISDEVVTAIEIYYPTNVT